MNKTIIYLNNLELKTFTEQDALDYCLLNNLNPENITELILYKNQLTNISGIRLFKNLEKLWLYNNKITDISVLKNLKNLKSLSIANNNLTDISVIKYLNKLKQLNISNNKIKDISVVKNLTELEILYINNLELESDQIQYINSLNNLKELIYYKGFKDMSVLNKLNKNINIIK